MTPKPKKDVCNLSDEAFLQRGFYMARTFPHLVENQYLVLFDENASPDRFVYSRDSCVGFELEGELMKVHDVWVMSPFERRNGVGRKLVNGCLKDLARELGIKKLEAYSLATETAVGFWDSLEDWTKTEDRTYVSEVAP